MKGILVISLQEINMLYTVRYVFVLDLVAKFCPSLGTVMF